MVGDICLILGYSINFWFYFKVFKIGGIIFDQSDVILVFLVVGFVVDGEVFKEWFDVICKMYCYCYGKFMSVKVCVQWLLIIFYQKWFFLYYVYVIFGGFDEEGKGVVYLYDLVGSYEWE